MRLILIIFLIIFSLSCNENKRPTETILEKFDSVNRKLDSIKTEVNTSTAQIYDSLEIAMGPDKFSHVRQLYYHLNDFYGYITNMETRFRTYCGDTTGTGVPGVAETDLRLTNSFFIDQDNGEQLYEHLQFIKSKLLAELTNADIRKEIAAIGKTEASKENASVFAQYYFRNVPPLAALTILKSFEQNIRLYESTVLSKYVSNDIGNIKSKILQGTKK